MALLNASSKIAEGMRFRALASFITTASIDVLHETLHETLVGFHIGCHFQNSFQGRYLYQEVWPKLKYNELALAIRRNEFTSFSLHWLMLPTLSQQMTPMGLKSWCKIKSSNE
jgi:hypothetical protein